MKKILFVDDEPNVLAGLKRMLRPQHLEWDMTFVASGTEALATMSSANFDVVVTDMQMPGMNGAELLSKIKELHPATVRIVLSGHSNVEASMLSASVSHQVLAKPCDPKALLNIVKRACALGDLLDDPTLQKTLGSIGELPVLPRVYQALTKALADENVDIQEIGAIAEQDTGIASKILQLVNSSFFGLSCEINDLRQATAYLGINTIRDLVFCFEVFKEYEGCPPLPGFSVEREQRHSLLTARIARRISDDKASAELAFLAAMLHDVGKLVMATSLTEAFRTILEAGGGTKRPFNSVEVEVLGLGHSEIGAYLLGLWGMPYPIVEAVAHHHFPARIPGQETFGVLGATHVANALALELDSSVSDTAWLDEDYLRELGVLDKLPEWRALAAEEAGVEPEAA